MRLNNIEEKDVNIEVKNLKSLGIVFIVIILIFTLYGFSASDENLPVTIDLEGFDLLEKKIRAEQGGLRLGFDDAKIYLVYKKVLDDKPYDYQETLDLLKNIFPKFELPDTYTFSEKIPSLVGKERIEATSVRLEVSESTKFKEVYFFQNNGYLFGIFYEDKQADDEFYKFLEERLSFGKDRLPDKKGFVSSIQIFNKSSLGYDQAGRKLITKMVMRNGMNVASGLAGRENISPDNKFIELKIRLINYTQNFVEAGTIEGKIKIGEKTYTTDTNIYFSLNPNGIVDYITTIAYKNKYDEEQLTKALSTLEVMFKYKENGQEKEMILNTPTAH